MVLTNPDCAAKCRSVALDYFRFTGLSEHRRSAPEVIWIYGTTGSGKSRLAEAYCRKVAGEDYYFHAPGSLKWWDGYEEQSAVILDDLRRRHLREVGGFSYLLRILDRYDCQIEVKGGFRKNKYNLVIITGQRDPVAEFTYRGDNNEDIVEEDMGQLIRRLARIIELRVLDGVVQEIDHTDVLKQRFGVLSCG
ncbi:REP 2 [Rodent stool-associated circular genome virus]|uniref:Replication-associated protein n=1 Tax=Rodent stool-associated circular genome virus TaxID=1074214 RepID=G1C9G9_9VIRU|nr:REP 2 [Rodent stool-associated circular genome virus]AEM05813.1 REP 2 [Rodent stool-associated circular genome virus]AEM05815.1 REP 2 [Rodent stool-associated circular genome virus]